MTKRLILHGYWRSSTAFRVRMALNLKGIAYDQVTHDLRTGAQRAADYLAVNPQGLVPALILPGGARLTQSLAIIEWLEETTPEPPLLPADPLARARVRAIAQAVALDVHPLNNLRVLNALRADFGADDAAVAVWFRRWAGAAFAAIEAMLETDRPRGRFVWGDRPGLADLCLVAQSVNNQRFQVDEAPYPTIRAIVAAALEVPAIAAALPQNQPDADPA